MALRYYRYKDSTSGTTSNSFNDWQLNSSTSAGPYFSNSTWYRPFVHCRRILVRNPDHWTEDDAIAFTNLVNVETKTGWRVTMIIKGDVLITDPNIESRTMTEFLPLLEWQASRTDLAKIREFFKEHSLEAPASGNGGKE